MLVLMEEDAPGQNIGIQKLVPVSCVHAYLTTVYFALPLHASSTITILLQIQNTTPL